MRRFWNTVDVYFAHDRKLITAGNLQKVQHTAFIALLLLFGYYLLSLFPDLDVAFLPAHRFLVIVNGIAAVSTLVMKKLKLRNYMIVQGLVLAYVAIHYTVFIALTTVIDLTMPSSIFCACLLITPSIFYIAPYITIGMNFGFSAVFIILAFINREASVMWHDVFSVTINVALSFVIMYSLTKVRVTNFYNALQLSNLAGMDKVGKVYNKTNFHDICDNLCEMGPSDSNRAMMMFSIADYFDLEEDFGRQTKDEVIRVVGQAIAANAAEADVVGRISADTFALFLNSVDSESQLRHIDVEIRRMVRTKARRLTNREIVISSGAVYAETEDFAYTEIMEATDNALYTSRMVGNNTITVNHLQKMEYRLNYA